MRAFLALPVSDAVLDAAARLQEELRKAGADVSWTRRGQMHLTLKFLGEIDPAQEFRLAELLAARIPRRPIDLEYAGLGRFPNVIWAGVKGDLAPLAALAETAAEEVGVPREGRPYTPHLTLGRIRSPRNARDLEAAAARKSDVSLGRDAPSELILYESARTPGGFVYEARRRLELR